MFFEFIGKHSKVKLECLNVSAVEMTLNKADPNFSIYSWFFEDKFKPKDG